MTVFITAIVLIINGCATPYSPYGVAGAGYQQQYYSNPVQANSNDPFQRAKIACQQQLGPPPTIADQAVTAIGGALLGAGGNAAFNAIIGGDPGRGAALGALGGGAVGGGIAAMQPAQYQEAFTQCVNQTVWQQQQQQEEEYNNRPCETERQGVRKNNGQWQTEDRFNCNDRTYSPPLQIPSPAPSR